MSLRVWIERGTPFRFRISKTGKDAETATIADDFLIREDINLCVPFVTGSIVVAAGGNETVVLGATYAQPPLIILKNSANEPPGRYRYYARMQSDMASLKIYNEKAVAITVTYFVFQTTLG